MNATCTMHPDRLATRTCSQCRRPICGECAQSIVSGQPVCTQCVEASRARHTGSAPSAPSAIPMSTPSSRPAAPMNIPRPNAPPYGTPPADLAPLAPQPPMAASPAGLQPAPLLGGPEPDAPLTQAPLTAAPVYGQPVAPPLYGQPQQAVALNDQPLYGQPSPPTSSPGMVLPPQYGQPGTGSQPGSAPYGAPGGVQPSPYGVPGTGYGQRPLASQSAPAEKSNVALALIVGIVLVVALGGGIGYASIAMGVSIPLLSIINGLIVGHAVRAVGGAGQAQGIIGGVCSALACAVTLGVMYLGNFVISPVAFVILIYATMRGYRIASGFSNY